MLEFEPAAFATLYSKIGTDVQELRIIAKSRQCDLHLESSDLNLDRNEYKLIEYALKKTATQKEAGELLGVSERVMSYKMRQHGFK